MQFVLQDTLQAICAATDEFILSNQEVRKSSAELCEDDGVHLSIFFRNGYRTDIWYCQLSNGVELLVKDGCLDFPSPRIMTERYGNLDDLEELIDLLYQAAALPALKDEDIL